MREIFSEASFQKYMKCFSKQIILNKLIETLHMHPSYLFRYSLLYNFHKTQHNPKSILKYYFIYLIDFISYSIDFEK